MVHCCMASAISYLRSLEEFSYSYTYIIEFYLVQCGETHRLCAFDFMIKEVGADARSHIQDLVSLEEFSCSSGPHCALCTSYIVDKDEAECVPAKVPRMYADRH